MILLVGQAPSRTSDPASALSPAGRSGRRLLELSGLSEEAFGARALRINLSDRWPGKNGKGDRFPRLIDDGVLSLIAASAMIVFVGRGVAERMLGASVARELEPCCWYFSHRPRKLYAVLPHPSGVNRWWNDAANVRRAKRFLREALSDARETRPSRRPGPRAPAARSSTTAGERPRSGRGPSRARSEARSGRG